MDRKRRWEEKQKRLQHRREMRAKGLDPDMVDAEGNPLPGGAAEEEEELAGDEASGGDDEAKEQ